jgi:hypothetical protein
MQRFLGQPNDTLNKRQARYLRDLQPFMGTMTLTYRKEALSDAYPLNWRPNFVLQATFPMF